MSKISRIKPAGWLALAVVAILVIAVLGLAVRAVWPRMRGIEGLQPMAEYTPPPVTPTVTPRPTVTPTDAPTGTPAGWTVQRDIAGDEYLAPPPEAEAAIRETFDVAMAVMYVKSDNNDDALQMVVEDRGVVVEKANRLTDFTGWNWTTPDWGPMAVEIIPPPHWGPENPVRCEDYDTCIVTWVKNGTASGIICYQEDICQVAVGSEAPCLISSFTDKPYLVRIFTIELQEDNVWRITGLKSEELSPPP